jgi:hypothetical protein
MKIRSAPYQEDLSELDELDDGDDEEDVDVSDFFSAALESDLSAPEEADAAFSRRRLAVP